MIYNSLQYKQRLYNCDNHETFLMSWRVGDFVTSTGNAKEKDYPFFEKKWNADKKIIYCFSITYVFRRHEQYIDI